MLTALTFTLTLTSATAQTLYVPGGTVGTSSNGNVGIGTTGPASLLSIYKASGDAILGIENTGNGNSSGIDFVRQRLSGTGVQGGAIFMDSDTATNNAFLYLQAQTSGAKSGVKEALVASNGARMVLRGGAGEISFENGATESARFSAAGNLGIGTANPKKTLEVSGDDSPGTVGTAAVALRLFNRNIAAAGKVSEIQFASDNTSQPVNNQVFAAVTGSVIGAGAGTHSYGDLVLSTRNQGGTLNQNLIVKNTGNVGIGTTTPSHKLSVNGTVRAKEVIVDTGWSDYVFDEGYRLTPLSEVEAHIRDKKHLPGIPSAAEVAQGGVSLGDMQARLLAKVEELTLHQIAQNKRLDEQAAKIAALEQENRRLRAQTTNP